MTDKKLTEYYQSIQGILLANHFTIETLRDIAFGLQFTVSREEKSGLIRIYQRKNGIFTLDFTPIKDPELLKCVRQLLDKKPPAASIPENPPGSPVLTTMWGIRLSVQMNREKEIFSARSCVLLSVSMNR